MAERTKLWIAQTMKELMKKKPIEEIRVTEICKAAEIERPTFYYHFRDKHDLVAWIFYQGAFKTNVIGKEEAAEALRSMKQDLVFYRRAYEDVSQNALWKYMLEYFTERYMQIAMERLHTDALDEQMRFSIRLYCYGTLGMTKEWALYDNTTPAETAVEMMFRSMPDFLQKVFFDTVQ
ncbi:MAG: TetR/AcrR family transcriptional regulator C-terminal domain-containing protein [Solobacterium sp.]|nr:TetR/AcrR family transcriptional regulator C-terminal domain-containing protein [Solobacterium sp.]